MTPAVVVIGGGPAGLAAAIAFGRKNVPTLVVERRALPADKACGEGLLPNAVDALERLGIDRSALSAIGHPIAGVRYVGPRGASAECRFASRPGFGLRRTELSALLLQQARRWPSVEIMTGVRADVRPGPRGPAVHAAGRLLTPSLVVAADGLGSRARAAVGIATRDGRSPRWGMRQHLDVPAWSEMVEVHFGRGFDVYITPLGRSINVAVLWSPRAVAVCPTGRAVLDMARRLRQLDGVLSEARPLSRVQAAGPFARRAVVRAIDGLVLLGDAAGYLDALTGEGVGLALAQAECLGRHAGKEGAAAERPMVTAAELAAFAREVEAAERPNRQLTTLMMRIAARPWLVDRVITALGSRPLLFAHALGANTGDHPLWPVPLAAWRRRAGRW